MAFTRPFLRTAQRPSLTLALGLFLGITSGVAGGCDRSKDKSKEKPEANAAAKDDAAADKDGKEKDAVAADAGADAAASTPCGKYAEAICDAVGKETPTCAQAKGFVTDYLSPKACEAGIGDIAYTQERAKELGKVCEELKDRLCKDIGEETDACKLVKDKIPGFPPEQCKQMSTDYDKVLGELKAMEAKNKPLDEAAQKKISAADAPSFGPADAKVTIVEFSDFQCPFCTRAATATSEIKKKFGDKVRVVFRQFPLGFHQDAHLASQAALAAHEQGKFWEYHDLLFKNQSALKREDLEKYAAELKLDLSKFKSALDTGKYKQTVDDDMKLGGEVTVQGTPTMFLNGKRVANATAFEAIESEINAALGAG
jgi:protein-disulfide isomerase